MSPRNVGEPGNEGPASEGRSDEQSRGLSLQDRLKIIFWDPGVVKLLISFLVFLGHIKDIDAFRHALHNDDFSGAEKYTDFSEEELRQRVISLKEESLRLMKAFQPS